MRTFILPECRYRKKCQRHADQWQTESHHCLSVLSPFLVFGLGTGSNGGNGPDCVPGTVSFGNVELFRPRYLVDGCEGSIISSLRMRLIACDALRRTEESSSFSVLSNAGIASRPSK